MKKINRIQQKDGFTYYEAILTDGTNLIDYSIRGLIWQLLLIHSIDLRKYLFKHSDVLSGVVNHSQLN